MAGMPRWPSRFRQPERPVEWGSEKEVQAVRKRQKRKAAS